MKHYTKLAITNPDDLIFGHSPHPVTAGFGLEIGKGMVFPEVNFTLPPMSVTDGTWPEVLAQYEEIGKTVLERLIALAAPGAVLEFELVPDMTQRPEWGAEIVGVLLRHLEQAHEKHGFKGALRATITDLRETGRRSALRTGPAVDTVFESFRRCAAAGAHILSIESIGGKDLHDPALQNADIKGIAFALGVLAPSDMAFLWSGITSISSEHSRIPGGDTACGFANTALALAHQRMLPEVLAAVVRAMCVARSLAAYEHGAIGPGKDCGYENIYLKMITGCPMAMEGKSAACAHFSPVGNIAQACCDTWSNESVQNVRLLSGMAPAVFAEVLAYDCRLMNEALKKGRARSLRDLLVSSDEWRSPQAAVLSPAAALKIASAVIQEETPWAATVAAGRIAVEIIRDGLTKHGLQLNARELAYLERIDTALRELPKRGEDLLAEMVTSYGEYFDPASYAL